MAANNAAGLIAIMLAHLAHRIQVLGFDHASGQCPVLVTVRKRSGSGTSYIILILLKNMVGAVGFEPTTR